MADTHRRRCFATLPILALAFTAPGCGNTPAAPTTTSTPTTAVTPAPSTTNAPAAPIVKVDPGPPTALQRRN